MNALNAGAAMTNAVFGFGSSISQASRIVDDLRAAGFAREHISVLFPRDAYAQALVYEEASKAPEGMAAGASAGGLFGGALGWLSGIGALAIPGIGPFIAAGPILAALSGAAVGATVGGITGGVVGLGIPEVEATEMERKIRAGEILVAVHVDTDEDRERATDILNGAGAADVGCAANGRVVELG